MAILVLEYMGVVHGSMNFRGTYTFIKLAIL